MNLNIYNGKLCIVDNWKPAYDDPVYYRSYWPIRPALPLDEDLTGKEVEVVNYIYGLYRIVDIPELKVRLQAGGKTLPIHIEEKPYKRPRKGKGYNWIYKSGKWQKDYSGIA